LSALLKIPALTEETLLLNLTSAVAVCFFLNYSINFDVFVLFFYQDEYVFAIKQARRREHDIAIVNAALRVLLEKRTKSSSRQIKDCSFSFGGMALTTVMAMKTMKSLIGR